MDKASIRSNLTQFSSSIEFVKAYGLPFVLGETNSYYCHGAAGVSDTAGAAIWALDYSLFASTIGVERLYFHEGVGYKYNFVRYLCRFSQRAPNLHSPSQIQPAALNRSIEDGTELSEPIAAHIQPAYYAAVILAEAIGSSRVKSVKVVELDIDEFDVSGYAFYDNGQLKRALIINMNSYTGSGTRGSVTVELTGVTAKKMTVKRLAIS